MKPAFVKPLTQRILLSFLLLVLARTASGAQLILQGDRVSLHTHNETLHDVLHAFAAYGIEVNVQPGVQAKVHGTLDDLPLRSALDRILGDFSYTLFWREIPYADTRIRVLDRIDVVLSGGQTAGPRVLMEPKEQPLLRMASGALYVADELLIGMRPGTKPEEFETLMRGIGGHIVGINRDLGVYRIRLPANSNVLGLINTLKNDPRVAGAEPNLVYELPTPGRSAERPSREVAPPRHAAPEGDAPLAILDSGLSPHLAGADFIAASYNAANPTQGIDDPIGHGTQMALIGSNRIAPNGVSRGDESVTPVIAIQAFDEKGRATASSLMDSLAFSRDSGASVVSLSWGTYEPSPMMELSLQQSVDAGQILLAAAGNDGSSRPMYPAAYPQVIAVGATNPQGSLWAKSNRGEHIDIAAPGFAYFPPGSGTGAEGTFVGTSISTPFVSRSVAQYKAENPRATPAQIRARLQSVSTPIEGQSGVRNFDEKARAAFLR